MSLENLFDDDDDGEGWKNCGNDETESSTMSIFCSAKDVINKRKELLKEREKFLLENNTNLPEDIYNQINYGIEGNLIRIGYEYCSIHLRAEHLKYFRGTIQLLKDYGFYVRPGELECDGDISIHFSNKPFSIDKI